MSQFNSKCSCTSHSTHSNDHGCNVLEDKVLQLQRSLSNAQIVIKTKDSIIQLQGEQLKKMEEMYKKCLDENELLNYANKKTCHDLENLKIILKQYENRRSSNIENASQGSTEKHETAEQLNNLYKILKSQEDKLRTIMKMYEQSASSIDNKEDIMMMGEQMQQLKKLSTQINELAKEAIQDTEEKQAMQEVISTLVIEISDLRLQINSLKNVELSLAIVDKVCRDSVKYVENLPMSARKNIPKEAYIDDNEFPDDDDKVVLKAEPVGEIIPKKKKRNSVSLLKLKKKSSKSNEVESELIQEVLKLDAVDDIRKELDEKDVEIDSLKNRISILENKSETGVQTSFHDKICLDQCSVEMSCKSSNMDEAKLNSESEKLVERYKTTNESLENATKELENQRLFLENENSKLKEEIKKNENRESCDYIAFKEALQEHTLQLKRLSHSTVNCASVHNQTIELENAELHEKVEELESKLYESQKLKISCLKNVAELKKDCNNIDYVKAKINFETQMGKLQDEIKEMKKVFMNYKIEASKIEEELRVENSNLRKELASKLNTKTDLDVKNKECNCLLDLVKKLRVEVEELRKDSDTYKKRFTNCNRELEKLKLDHANKVKSLEELLDKVQNTNDKYEGLVHKCERQKLHNDNLRAEKQTLLQECGYLKDQLKQQKELHGATQKCFDDFKKATEVLRNCTRQEIFSLGCEVKHLQNMQNSCKSIVTNQSNNEMQLLINECNEYKAKLDDMAEIIKEEQTYKKKSERNTKKLIDENEHLKCKLKVCSALMCGEERMDFNCGDLESAIKELDSFMKLKQNSISVSLDQMKKAKSILESISQNKGSTSSDSDSSLDCSKTMCLVQTNIQCLLNNLQQQNEEYGTCNHELQLREKFLDKKLCDIQDKKNSLFLCLTNINNSFIDSSKGTECNCSMCVPEYVCPHK